MCGLTSRKNRLSHSDGTANAADAASTATAGQAWRSRRWTRAQPIASASRPASYSRWYIGSSVRMANAATTPSDRRRWRLR